MAKIVGGILGNPSGATGGLVFGSARSRLGKVVTARSKVSPSNPNTTAQQAQRTIFARSLYIVRGWTADLWQVYFNRAIGQLPGFQSIMSILMNNVGSTGLFDPPADTPLGSLHFPATVTWSSGAVAGDVKVTWSTEIGDNGTASDTFTLFVWARAASATVKYGKSLATVLRSAGATGITISGLDTSGAYICGLFVSGAGDAAGMISKCVYHQQIAHS